MGGYKIDPFNHLTSRMKKLAMEAKKPVWQGNLAYRNSWNWPVSFRNRLCKCPHYEYDWTPGNIAWLCFNCHKAPEYLFNLCEVCGVHFIKDFSHPFFCTVDPTCWECSQKLMDYCEDHAVPEGVKKIIKLAKPLGLNPKVFSAEEVSAFSFDFE